MLTVNSEWLTPLWPHHNNVLGIGGETLDNVWHLANEVDSLSCSTELYAKQNIFLNMLLLKYNHAHNIQTFITVHLIQLQILDLEFAIQY